MGFRESKRIPAILSSKVNKRLVAYATAASAGLSAGTIPADAEIVYTPANTPIERNVPVALDLNHDGIIDFELSNNFISKIYTNGSGCSHGLCIFSDALKIDPVQTGNAIWATSSFDRTRGVRKKKINVAIPSPWGMYVLAPERRFQASNLVMDFYRVQRSLSSGTSQSGGPWNKGKEYSGPYLGLKFMINGEVHYGWARVEVQPRGLNITATLTGYAYETVPNAGIVTGLTHRPPGECGSATAASFGKADAASLGWLAQGATGLTTWRTKGDAAQDSGK